MRRIRVRKRSRSGSDNGISRKRFNAVSASTMPSQQCAIEVAVLVAVGHALSEKQVRRVEAEAGSPMGVA
jgi:hypothetical protein